jgi:hypothetical protein
MSSNGDTAVSPESKRKRKRKGSFKDSGKGGKGGEFKGADQLAWKKISLQNDEFEDFEEIEGVDIEYVDKDGHKAIQFKVCQNCHNESDTL